MAATPAGVFRAGEYRRLCHSPAQSGTWCEGFFHRAINTGRVQPADVMSPACIASRIKGSDFDSSKPCAGRRRSHTRSPSDVAPAPPAILQIFQAGNRFDIAVAAGNMVPFDCNKSISFSARSCVYGAVPAAFSARV